MKFRLPFAILFLSLSFQALQAQVTLVSWDFDGYGGSGNASSATFATFDNSLFSVGDFTRVGVSASAQTNTFAATGWDTTENAGKYFSVSVTVASGQSVDFDILNYYMTRKKTGNPKGPESFALYTSVDNFASPIGSSQFFNNGSESAAGFIDLTAVAGLQNVTGGTTVEFRFNGWEDTSWAGFGPNPGSSGDFALEGSVVPEPSTYALICGGLALALVFWRKRQPEH